MHTQFKMFDRPTGGRAEVSVRGWMNAAIAAAKDK